MYRGRGLLEARQGPRKLPEGGDDGPYSYYNTQQHRRSSGLAQVLGRGIGRGADLSGGGRGGLEGDLGARGGGPIGKLVQGIAAGIGLASESYHHHKEKKAARNAEDSSQTGAKDIGEEEGSPINGHGPHAADEVVWELDDTQRELDGGHNGPNNYSNIAIDDIPQLAEDFLAIHPLPTSPPSRGLSLPVVLTQRRPESRSRGFIRAYSPILQEDVGIDQPTFLEFIDGLNKALEPSPWIQAVNLAALAASAAPMGISMAVSAAVMMLTKAADEVHSRHKTNKFLDRMNGEFFQPRGLICLVMTWKPESAGQMITDVEFNSHIAMVAAAAAAAGSSSFPGGSSSKSTMASVKHNMQSSSGKSGFEFPEIAPLVFPQLDEIAEEGRKREEQKQTAVKRGRKFVGDYLDKRAVAKWAGGNPDSNLANAAPQPVFHSRYADPNHPASSGDPIALLTGGRFSGGRGVTTPSGPVGEGSRGVGWGNDAGLGGRWGLGGPLQEVRGGGRDRGGLVDLGISPLALIGGVKKLLQKDVLYLMVVNMPTAEQISQVRAMSG
ncbi:hypothetical protein BX600DRAFT_275017 [Xylariales sp. PMI_506]|nr:hypothetical protein BX600DRAFT_275017 [Xylariales sp. PMI_506]